MMHILKKIEENKVKKGTKKDLKTIQNQHCNTANNKPMHKKLATNNNTTMQKFLFLSSLLATSAFGFSPVATNRGVVSTSLKVRTLHIHIQVDVCSKVPMMSDDAILGLARASTPLTHFLKMSRPLID